MVGQQPVADPPDVEDALAGAARASLRRRREACESSVRVRPSDRKPQTSRSSSSFVKTRVGCVASLSSSSYSFAASATVSPSTRSRAASARSIAIGPARSRSRIAGLRPPQHGADPRQQLLVVERPRRGSRRSRARSARTRSTVSDSRLAEHDHRHVAVPERPARPRAGAADLERRRVRRPPRSTRSGRSRSTSSSASPPRPHRGPRSRRSPGGARGTPRVAARAPRAAAPSTCEPKVAARLDAATRCPFARKCDERFYNRPRAEHAPEEPEPEQPGERRSRTPR